MENKEIKLGKYRHFKGHLCEVIGVAKYSEGQQKEFVIYKHLDEHGKMQLWARPKEMFLENVEVNGKKIPRFEYMRE